MTDVVLLDGGMGQELIRRSPDDLTPLWGTTVMRDRPELVRALHEDFLRAGAKVLTVNAYSATRVRLERHGEPGIFEAMQQRACELAMEAIDGMGADAAIAGCLPPLVGSYHPESSLAVDEAATQYAEIVALQGDYADVFIAETMSSINEAQGAVAGMEGAGKPLWVAFTTHDDDGTRLRSGEPVAEAVDAVKDGAAALLINCTRPEVVGDGLEALAKAGLPFGAYANGFTRIATDYVPGASVDKLETRRDLTPDAYADHAMAWVGAGATIVGGCCEVGPAHIAVLSQRLAAAGHEIVKEPRP